MLFSPLIGKDGREKLGRKGEAGSGNVGKFSASSIGGWN